LGAQAQLVSRFLLTVLACRSVSGKRVTRPGGLFPRASNSHGTPNAADGGDSVGET